MRKSGILFVVMLIALLLVTPSVVRAAEPSLRTGTYAGVFAGYTVPNKLDTDNRGDLSMDNGWVLGAKIGTPIFGDWGLGVEGEYAYAKNDISNINGSLSSNTIMANLLWKIPVTWYIKPYVGAGIGWSWGEISDLPGNDGSSGDFAWQALAGFEVPLTPQFTLDFRYKYFWCKYGIGPDVTFENNMFIGGVNWYFQ